MLTWTLHIHKIGVWTLNKSFLFVLSSLMFNRRLKEVFSQLKDTTGYIISDVVTV